MKKMLKTNFEQNLKKNENRKFLSFADFFGFFFEFL